MGTSWIGVILIGFFAGLLARFFAGNPKSPQGCLLTTVLGIVGAALFTWIGQTTGVYAPGQRAGFIGAVVGALIVLALWRLLLDRRAD